MSRSRPAPTGKNRGQRSGRIKHQQDNNDAAEQVGEEVEGTIHTGILAGRAWKPRSFGALMRMLVTGGRDFSDREFLFDALDRLHAAHGFTVLIHGDENGADRL